MISTADCHLGTISKPRGGCRGSSVALAWLGKTGSLVRIAASGDNSGSWIYGAYHQSYQVVAGSFESSQGIAVARLSVWEHGESNIGSGALAPQTGQFGRNEFLSGKEGRSYRNSSLGSIQSVQCLEQWVSHGNFTSCNIKCGTDWSSPTPMASDTFVQAGNDRPVRVQPKDGFPCSDVAI